MITEFNTGTGCLRDSEDARDFVFGAAPVQIDWEKGYDVETVLGGKLSVNNQGHQLSCTGQATSKYLFVRFIKQYCDAHGVTLNVLRETYPELVKEFSALAIYSQVYLPQGGAEIRLAVKQGVSLGAVLASVNPTEDALGNPKSELQARDLSWLTQDVKMAAQKLQEAEYHVIPAGCRLETLAGAIQDNLGVVFGVDGQNNGTWFSLTPQPPIGAPDWGHCMYAKGFGMINGKKAIKVHQSWGPNVGDHGTQWLTEDYFIYDAQFVFNPWVYVDKPITPDNTNRSATVTLYKVAETEFNQDGSPKHLKRDIMNQPTLIKSFLNNGWQFEELPNAVY